MKYKVIESNYINDFEKACTTYIENDWLPAGGVSIKHEGSLGKVYYQSFYKRKKQIVKLPKF